MFDPNLNSSAPMSEGLAESHPDLSQQIHDRATEEAQKLVEETQRMHAEAHLKAQEELEQLEENQDRELKAIAEHNKQVTETLTNLVNKELLKEGSKPASERQSLSMLSAMIAERVDTYYDALEAAEEADARFHSEIGLNPRNLDSDAVIQGEVSEQLIFELGVGREALKVLAEELLRAWIQNEDILNPASLSVETPAPQEEPQQSWAHSPVEFGQPEQERAGELAFTAAPLSRAIF